MSLEVQTEFVQDFSDKEQILKTLENFSDLDFNGENNDEEFGDNYNWEITDKLGFSSNQQYVLDFLRKSDLTGMALVSKYFELWLDGATGVEEYNFTVGNTKHGNEHYITIGINWEF